MRHDPNKYYNPPPSLIDWPHALAVLDAIALPAILAWWVANWPVQDALGAIAHALLFWWGCSRAIKAWRTAGDRKWWVVRKLKWFAFLGVLAFFVINRTP